MTTRLKIALSAAFALLSLDMLTRFLQWMNRSSDAWFYAGACGSLSLLVLVPGVLGTIWRDHFTRLKRP
jgi:hypothetical protein